MCQGLVVRLMMNKRKWISFVVFSFFVLTIGAEGTNYDKDKVLLSFENADKKETVVLLTAIRRSIDYYESSKDKKFLLRFIQGYKDILNHKDAFFLVDPLADLYKKNPKLFKSTIKEALSSEDSKRLMEHIENILREAREGNG